MSRLLMDMQAELSKESLPPGKLLIQLLTKLPQDLITGAEEFKRRRGLQFEVRAGLTVRELTYVDQPEIQRRFALAPDAVLATVVGANNSLLALEQFTRMLRVPIGKLLGMRNLSSLVSSVIVSELAVISGENLFINPHQDGYPDLIPRTPEALAYSRHIEASGRWSDKSAWTNPGFGGVEVKATCGITPPTRITPKPGLGEERSPLIKGFDWKAHHRETRRLLAAIWDFVDTVPTVTAIFFRNDLKENDWGGIVSPRAGGGRTTSVSIMTKMGVRRMADRWIVRPRDPALRQALSLGRVLVNGVSPSGE